MRGIITALAVSAAWSAAAQDRSPQAAPGQPPPARSAEAAAGDASALTGSLGVGVTVDDSLGQPIGRVIRLETGHDGQTLVRVRQGAEAYLIPLARFALRRGAATLDETRDQLKADDTVGH